MSKYLYIFRKQLNFEALIISKELKKSKKTDFDSVLISSTFKAFCGYC